MSSPAVPSPWTGPFTSYENQYAMHRGGLPMNAGRFPAPALSGMNGGSFRDPRTQFTSVSDQQRAPSAPFKVLTRIDADGHTNLYNQGEFLWNYKSTGSIRDEKVCRAISLWDLNLQLRRSHEHWVDRFQHCTSVEDAYRILHQCIRRPEYRTKAQEIHESADGMDENFFKLIELSNIYNISDFLKTSPYLGPTIDPTGTDVKNANQLAGLSGTKMFVVEAMGRVKVPNIFRASLPGTEVGFMITKFQDPFTLNDCDLDFRTIMNSLRPLQIWPVSNFNRRFPHFGYYHTTTTTWAESEAFDYCWSEQDPTAIQPVYTEYHAKAERASEHSTSMLKTWTSVRPAYYFSVGTVDTTTFGKVPTTEQVAAAVSPKESAMGPNAAWQRLMESNHITIYARSPSFDFTCPIHRMKE